LHPTEQLAVHAARGQATFAIEARTAAGRERTDDAIAYRQRLHRTTHLDNFAEELVTHDSANIEAGFAAEVWVQVRAADRSQLHPDKDIARIANLWLGDVLQHDVTDAAKGDRSHRDIVDRRDKK
jgi:hypothetical protein